MLQTTPSTFTKKRNLYSSLLVTTGCNERIPTPKVLVVEDNFLIQYTTQKTLENLGCRVDIANTGKQALILAKQNYYNLIFMDIELPDLSGLEITREIRQGKYWSKGSPIVVITSHTENEIKKECMLSGTNEVLTKPVYSQKFEDLLKAYVVF